MNSRRFSLQELLHGPGKFRMRQPVCGVGGNGEEAARDFVFALRSCLKRHDSASKSIVDCLIIAELKMEIAHLFASAPVTPK